MHERSHHCIYSGGVCVLCVCVCVLWCDTATHLGVEETFTAGVFDENQLITWQPDYPGHSQSMGTYFSRIITFSQNILNTIRL